MNRLAHNIEIRAATTADCRAVAKVHVASWQQAYHDILPDEFLASLSVTEREAMWRRMVELQPSHLLVACANEHVVGFVAFGASHDDEDTPTGRAEIFAIYVDAAYWGSGVGRRLWQEALRHISAEGYRSIGLWVLAENARAIRFYERAGFVVEPESRKSFELGDAVAEELRYVHPVA